MIIIIPFLLALVAILACALYCFCRPAQPEPAPLTMDSVLAFLVQRNSPEYILRNITFVGHSYRFALSEDFRLCFLRNEYECLRDRIRGLAEYLDSEHGQSDSEYHTLINQLAVMYAYLEIIELRCINAQYLLPIPEHEEYDSSL